MAAIKPNENANGGDNDATKDEAFRQRLDLLVKEHSVRGLARKLDIPNQSVGNYLKKSQPPLSFGRKLVEKLGVNPAWVLTGEGSPMLSDVAEATSTTAADLMDLVKAMNDVTRMRLGALSGKQQAQALRELNDAMVRYEELRGKLNAYSRPVMEKLLNDMAVLLAEPGVKISEHLHSLMKAGEQVARFCEDSDLLSAYKRRRARYLHRLGDFDGASTLAREVVAYEMLSGSVPGVDGLSDVQNLVAVLHQQYRLREAQQIAEAALIFAQSGDTNAQAYLQLLESAAMLDAVRGNLARARERILQVLPRMDEVWRRRSTMPLLSIAHFFAGAVSYREALNFCGGIDTPFILAPLVYWTEKPDDLEHSKRLLEKHQSVAPTRLAPLICVTSLLQALRGAGSVEALDKALAVVPVQDASARIFRTMNYPVIRCQVALAAGQRAQAVKAIIETDKALEQAKPHAELPIGTAAVHHRNVLRASADSKDKYLAAARTRALDFFKRHIDAGYAVFRTVLDEDSISV